MSNNFGASSVIQDIFLSLEELGLVDVFLPFLLVFTLVFAVLSKTMILGAEKRNLNVVLSLVMGLAVVIPHVTNTYPIGFDPVEIINRMLPSVSLLVVAVFMVLILIGVFAHDKVFLGLTMPGWIGFFSIVAIIFIFLSSAGILQNGILNAFEQFFGSEALKIVIIILVFGIIIAFITGSGSDEKAGILSKVGVNLGELFGGKK